MNTTALFVHFQILSAALAEIILSITVFLLSDYGKSALLLWAIGSIFYGYLIISGILTVYGKRRRKRKKDDISSFDAVLGNLISGIAAFGIVIFIYGQMICALLYETDLICENWSWQRYAAEFIIYLPLFFLGLQAWADAFHQWKQLK